MEDKTADVLPLVPLVMVSIDFLDCIFFALSRQSFNNCSFLKTIGTYFRKVHLQINHTLILEILSSFPEQFCLNYIALTAHAVTLQSLLLENKKMYS